MAFELMLFASAENDAQEAFLWYEAQSLGLGDAFYSELLKCLGKLTITPENYGFAYKKFRRIFLKKFPFQVVYLVTANTVSVHAILHKNRSKKALVKRLK